MWFVQSAGFSDGNEVSFWLNGKQLHSSSARGLTIVVLAVDGEVVGAPKTFDTNQDSAEVEIFLQSLASNTTVLVGVSDEASSGLTDRGRALIQACGGQQIGRLQFRDSYALIGVPEQLSEDFVCTSSYIFSTSIKTIGYKALSVCGSLRN